MTPGTGMMIILQRQAFVSDNNGSYRGALGDVKKGTGCSTASFSPPYKDGWRIQQSIDISRELKTQSFSRRL